MMMTLLGHAIFFFVAGFNGYLMNADRGNGFGIFLLIALPVTGVYLLGWWALLTFFIGVLFGARMYWNSVRGR